MVDLMGNVHISPVLWGAGGVKDFRHRQEWDWRHRHDVEERRFGFVGAIGVAAAWWCFLDGGGGLECGIVFGLEHVAAVWMG